MNPEQMEPITVKSFDGEQDVNIKSMQESLREWPLHLQAVLGNDGRAAIMGAVYATHKCGCSIKGNGTLQFPLTIEFCEKHKN